MLETRTIAYVLKTWFVPSIGLLSSVNVTFGKLLHFVTVSTIFFPENFPSNRSSSNIIIPRISKFHSKIHQNELPKIDFLLVVIFQRCDTCNENLYEKGNSRIFFLIEEIVVPFLSIWGAQKGSVFALFIAVRVRTGHQLGAGGSRRRVCLYSSFTGGLIVRCDQLLARRSLWSQEALFFFILGRKRPEEVVEKLERACVFFRINLLSRSLNRFKDERLLIIPPLFFLVNLTFLFSLLPLWSIRSISLSNFLIF